MRLFLSLVFLLFSFVPLETVEGRVISVKDGDSIEIIDSNNGNTVEVQLYGIDCPELGQSYGEEAKTYTKSLCYHENVIIQSNG